MYDLVNAIPEVTVLLSLEPEELGAKLLFLLKKRLKDPNTLYSNNGQFILGNLESEFWERSSNPNQPQYPREKKAQISMALVEAWAWLEAQGLLVPAGDTNGQNGWRVLSRRAQKIQTESEFASYKVARLLPKELLHSRISDTVWGAFMRGEFDVAAFQAMKGVEVAVRAATGLGAEFIGVKLMRAAFAPDGGQLTDITAEGGERVGRMELFSGAIASYKNPHSHRDVNLEDPYEALEIVFLANHLLRIVDSRSRAKDVKS